MIRRRVFRAAMRDWEPIRTAVFEVHEFTIAGNVFWFAVHEAWHGAGGDYLQAQGSYVVSEWETGLTVTFEWQPSKRAAWLLAQGRLREGIHKRGEHELAALLLERQFEDAINPPYTPM